MSTREEIRAAAQKIADAQVRAASARSGAAQIETSINLQAANDELERILSAENLEAVETAGEGIIDAVKPAVPIATREQIYTVTRRVLDVATAVSLVLIALVAVVAIWSPETAAIVGVVGTALGAVSQIVGRWVARLAGKNLADPV